MHTVLLSFRHFLEVFFQNDGVLNEICESTQKETQINGHFIIFYLCCSDFGVQQSVHGKHSMLQIGLQKTFKNNKQTNSFFLSTHAWFHWRIVWI